MLMKTFSCRINCEAAFIRFRQLLGNQFSSSLIWWALVNPVKALGYFLLWCHMCSVWHHMDLLPASWQVKDRLKCVETLAVRGHVWICIFLFLSKSYNWHICFPTFLFFKFMFITDLWTLITSTLFLQLTSFTQTSKDCLTCARTCFTSLCRSAMWPATFQIFFESALINV